MAITYPTLTENYSSRDFIDAFGGYNHNLRIGENEFYDMKNLTSSYYPLLSTRQPRGTVVNYNIFDFLTLFQPVGMVDNAGLNMLLCTPYTMSDEVSYALLLLKEENYYFVGYTTIGAEKKRSMVSMGANVVIFPEKKYFNVTELSEATPIDFGSTTIFEGLEGIAIAKDMEAVCDYYPSAHFYLCRADGTKYDVDTMSNEAPTDVENGHIWLDTSTDPSSLKIYSEANSSWASVMTTYIRIEAMGISEKFDVYDGVRISNVFPEDLSYLNGTMVIQALGTETVEIDGGGTSNRDYIVVIGHMDCVQQGNYEWRGSTAYGRPVKVERIVPDMDFVIESNNRLWGCRYGLNRDGDFVNEIYASKLGDFKNWECFQGTSTDSYVASVGADGNFTGAVSYLGYPLFFKQDCLYTVYGSYPATYQVQLTECRGVQQGCHNSLVAIDGVLYYKALGGVCAYNGSLPVEIGSALGEVGKRYYGAYAGAYRHKYYIGMRDVEEDTGTWLYVYDTEKGMWHKEDKYNGAEFCYCSSGDVDQLYYITDGKVKAIIGEAEMQDVEKDIHWYAETGVLGCSSPDKKYISKISIRFSVNVGTRIRVFAEYDSSGDWEQLAVFTGTRLGAFTLPFKPRRCDHLRLKIEGYGQAKIYSISKTMEDGGEV